MKVFLVRHSHAVSEGSNLSDPNRFLSAPGRRTARAVGQRLSTEGVAFDAILTSPLVRAVQTAELLAHATSYTGIIEALPALAPGFPPRLVASELAARGVAIAVVGHEPAIAALGALLVQRPSFPPFRPAQVVLIEDGRPVWMLHPETLEIDRLLVA